MTYVATRKIDGGGIVMVETFEPGDVVRLRSGGPNLTVDDMECQPGLVPVLWFAGDILRKNSIPAIMLNKAEYTLVVVNWK